MEPQTYYAIRDVENDLWWFVNIDESFDVSQPALYIEEHKDWLVDNIARLNSDEEGEPFQLVTFTVRLWEKAT
jgi:hypothetical protein